MWNILRSVAIMQVSLTKDEVSLFNEAFDGNYQVLVGSEEEPEIRNKRLDDSMLDCLSLLDTHVIPKIEAEECKMTLIRIKSYCYGTLAFTASTLPKNRELAEKCRIEMQKCYTDAKTHLGSSHSWLPIIESHFDHWRRTLNQEWALEKNE